MTKILIADDEVIERAVLEKKLKKNYERECRILVAQNGRQAIEIHERERPQVLILDIEMPGINGLEAAREIRKRDASCGIIFLTAFDEFSYAKAAISVRALDYLLKPCDDKELISAVDEALRLARFREPSRMPEAPGHLEGPGKQEFSDEQPEKIRAYIAGHYREDISVMEIAGFFGYSEAYFCKLFKQYFGHSFVSYLTDYRMRKAEELMRDGALSIKEIGRMVGYPDPNYFTKVFRRTRGLSPSAFRDAASLPGRGKYDS